MLMNLSQLWRFYVRLHWYILMARLEAEQIFIDDSIHVNCFLFVKIVQTQKFL